MSIVDEAETALRAFGKLTRAEARKLLPMWSHYGELKGWQRKSVLERFAK